MICIIPARRGSKRLTGKNRRTCAGKRLTQWTIEAACEVFDPKCIYLSTDDPLLSRIGCDYGIRVIARGAYAASDDAKTKDVIDEVMSAVSVPAEEGNNEWLRHHAQESFCLLQPTSPCRTSKHIREALAMWDDKTCVPVYSTWLGQPNGAIYICPTSSHLHSERFIGYEMDAESSIDIDTLYDFERARKVLEERNAK